MSTREVKLRISASGDKQVQSALGRVTDSLDLTSKASKLAGIALGSLSLAKLAHDLVDVNVRYQRLEASLYTLTGSAEGASAQFAALREFAKETPSQLEDVVTAFSRLKAMGLDPSNDALRAYGNTASAMGKDLMQMVEAVADAATGEFERLKEFGIRASSQGDRVSLTFQGVTTTIGKNSAEIERYLQNLGRVQFAGAMDRQMETLGGAISNLKDAYSTALKEMGDAGLNSELSKAIRGLSDTISSPEFITGITFFATKMAQAAEASAKLVGFAGTMAEKWGGGTPINLNQQQPWLNAPGQRPTDVDGNLVSASAHRVRIGPQTKGYAAYAAVGGGTPVGGAAPGADTSKEDAAAAARAEREAERQRQRLQAQLQQVQESLYSEEQAINASHAARQATLVEARNAELLSQQDFAALEIQLQQEKNAQLQVIEQRLADEKRRIDEEEQARQRQVQQLALQNYQTMQQGLYTIAQGSGKSMMKLYQATTLPVVLANAYKAASGVFADTPGPWWTRAAAYAAALGQGMTAYSTVRSIVGGGGGGAGYGGGTPASPVVTQPLPQQRDLTIVVKSEVHGIFDAQLLENTIIPMINDAGTRNVRIEYDD